MRATYLTNLINLDYLTLTILGEEYKLTNPSFHGDDLGRQY
jgi:hypothetical protein